MELNICLLVAALALIAPTQALLGAKLALLGALRNSFGSGGYSNDAAYGGSNGGNDNGGYAMGRNYNRPVYTGQSSNYGWGQESYGGGYRSSYNGGNQEPDKVIKVIVQREPAQVYYENYGRNAVASAVLSSSGSRWSSVPPAATPVVQTYAAQPVQSVQVSAPDSVQVPLQVSSLAPVRTQAIQPPPVPVFIQSQQLQPAYQQVARIPSPQAQQTIRLIVDGENQNIPAQTYGPPPPAPTYVAPTVDNTGAWNSDSWSSATGGGWNNIGGGLWKKGRIWQSAGC